MLDAQGAEPDEGEQRGHEIREGAAERGRTDARQRKVTLGEVARRAEVSLATASKVMNARADVRRETRERVARIAQELGYSPRARAAVPGPVALIRFPRLDSPYVIDILAGAEHAARRAGAQLLVETGGGDLGAREPLTRERMEDAARRGAAGVIAVTTPVGPEHARWSRELDLPLIVIDPISVPEADVGAPVPDLVTIAATNWEGAVSAVRHLAALGHRRIATLAGPEESIPGRQRLQGYRSGLEQQGIAFDPALVRHGRFDDEDGEIGAAQLLDLEDPPTAIFAASDGLGVGVLREARRRGLDVPGDLSVLGFDDTIVCRWTWPRLTTIRQPLFAMGQVAVERLLALAADPELFAHPFQLETRLVERESTGPAPTRTD
ncbi:substrate-binding domain-containing protein [Brachybacterium halotolerans subsp. kimchii]|uniref:LacI family DNA-binding transcriptional regulator n=1 Tax=Brachybacterium halotolerans TaxID=2795215 RepID=UPI001E554278|nr:substrate-binding domain-containing protein [Brachybacterium halotolerans]UEJ81615.1 substrate-binding domain-containing protein [Brachybacterium halotolerans subsp. kimchii]